MNVISTAVRVGLAMCGATVKFSGATICAGFAGSYLAQSHNASDRDISPEKIQEAISKLALATLLMGMSTALSASARASLTHKRQWTGTGSITALLQAATSVGEFIYSYAATTDIPVDRLPQILRQQPRQLLEYITSYTLFQQTIAQGAAPTLLDSLSHARMQILQLAAPRRDQSFNWEKPCMGTNSDRYYSHLTWLPSGHSNKSPEFADRLSVLVTGLNSIPHFAQKQHTVNELNALIFEIKHGSAPPHDLRELLELLLQNVHSVISHPFDNTLLLQIKALLGQIPSNTWPHPESEVKIDSIWKSRLDIYSKDALVQNIRTKLDYIGRSCAPSSLAQITTINAAITTGQTNTIILLETLNNQLPAIQALKPKRHFGQDSQRKLIALIEAVLFANKTQLHTDWHQTYFEVASDGTVSCNYDMDKYEYPEDLEDSEDIIENVFDGLFNTILTDVTYLKTLQDKGALTQLITQLESMQEHDGDGLKCFKNDQETLNKLPTILKDVQTAVSQINTAEPTGESIQLAAQVDALIAANFPT
ncbi:hypothetical protein COB21_00015 [Candidatus Aerophobetes bacterium]|uniref:Uncharacterized protein n=1 Tax=Aerophobetes bacterium TaxID=2030807 RepID=A0A2A4X9A6_UNCAE|nr:MAG: hypothetical protein COB21_00015 [Candidatus Aerophobetes bacterium]